VPGSPVPGSCPDSATSFPLFVKLGLLLAGTPLLIRLLLLLPRLLPAAALLLAALTRLLPATTLLVLLVALIGHSICSLNPPQRVNLVSRLNVPDPPRPP
jgi:hypothetical protein